MGLLGSCCSQTVYISAVWRRGVGIGAATVYDSPSEREREREEWVCPGVASSKPPPSHGSHSQSHTPNTRQSGLPLKLLPACFSIVRYTWNSLLGAFRPNVAK